MNPNVTSVGLLIPLTVGLGACATDGRLTGRRSIDPGQCAARVAVQRSAGWSASPRPTQSGPSVVNRWENVMTLAGGATLTVDLYEGSSFFGILVEVTAVSLQISTQDGSPTLPRDHIRRVVQRLDPIVGSGETLKRLAAGGTEGVSRFVELGKGALGRAPLTVDGRTLAAGMTVGSLAALINDSLPRSVVVYDAR